MNLKQIVDSVDRYYVDIKTTDSVLYKDYTGGSLENALENLEYLIEEAGADRIVVRIPIIPGFTTEKEQLQSRECLETMGVKIFDLFSYKKVDAFN